MINPVFAIAIGIVVLFVIQIFMDWAEGGQ